MFENKKTQNGIHYSRYIASWRRSGGKIYRGGLFERWLREKEHLTEDEINDILQMATIGKMELESSAEIFMNEWMPEHMDEKEMAYKGGHFKECSGTHVCHLTKDLEKLRARY